MSAPTRMRIVTGKGGVGKSSLAAALALAERAQKQRVLLVELGGQGSLPQLLGVPPTGYAIREVFEDLCLVDLNAQDALREYALMLLRFETLYKLVFENRLVRHFLRLVPSLAELVVLGKLWYHTQERARGERPYDVIVIDAPATGHAMALLTAPKTVLGVVPPGPLRDSTEKIWQMLARTDTQIHIVCCGEEMPVNEAIELASGIAALGLSLGCPLINQRLQPLAAPLAAAAERPDAPAAAACLRAHTRAWRAAEAELGRLPKALLDRAISLPEVQPSPLNRAGLEQLAGHLLAALGPR